MVWSGKVGDVLWCGEELWVMSYGVVRKGG